MLVNAMSVDVEEYFQVSAFEHYIPRSHWDHLPSRVEKSLDKIFHLFSEHDIKATFFTLGWIAERHPDLIRKIVSEGHELACHGYDHIRVTQQTPEAFYEDVKKSKQILEDIAGISVNGYRAASYSIGSDNLWALQILEELGFKYSSSIYPVKHDLYGMPDASRFAFQPENAPRLLEIPITTVRVLGRNFPCGGGGFFRLFPYSLSHWAIQQVNKIDCQPSIFYFHPWEIDPDQPKQKGIDVKTRFRHYLNLSLMESRLEQLLHDFHWNTMNNVFMHPHSLRMDD
jgi:polysaccharide deacetylase family protein (PEP-CTERM system associated)